MKINKYISILCLLLSVGCESKLNFDLPDRGRIDKPILLQTVKDVDGRLIEQFSYKPDNTLAQVILKGFDHYKLTYKDSLLTNFNAYECRYNAQNQLISVTGPGFVQAYINYFPNRIQIIQEIETIVPTTEAKAVDTLNIVFDARGRINSATLMPRNLAYSYNFDENITPYIGIRKTLIPLLLMYPIAEISPQLISLWQSNNLLRYAMQSTISQAGIEQVERTDFTYRFNHPHYDIPTSVTQHGPQSYTRYYEYSMPHASEKL